MAHTAREVIITRDVRYELRISLEPGDSIPPAVELKDMSVVNDSGPQIFIEITETKAA